MLKIAGIKKPLRSIYEFRSNHPIITKFLQGGATLLFSGFISLIVIYINSENYWKVTIYRTQTVDFNILANLLPTKLSTLILRKDSRAIQKTIDSNYGLFGIVITDCTSKEESCSGQKITYASKTKVQSMPDGGQILIPESDYAKGWHKIFDDGEYPAQRLNADNSYLLLRNPPPLNQEIEFTNPRDENTPNLKSINKGSIIGRVYFVRTPQPSFDTTLRKWLQSIFQNSSTNSTYNAILCASLGSGLLVFGLTELILRFQIKRDIAENKVQEITIKLRSAEQKYNREIKKLKAAEDKVASTTQELKAARQVAKYTRVESEKKAQELTAAENKNDEVTNQELEYFRQAANDAQVEAEKKAQELTAAEDRDRLRNKELEDAQQAAKNARVEIQNLTLLENEYQQDNAKLEKKNQKLTQDIDTLRSEKDRLDEENKVIKSENEKLKSKSSLDTFCKILKVAQEKHSTLEILPSAFNSAKTFDKKHPDLSGDYSAEVYKILAKLADFGMEYFNSEKSVGDDTIKILNDRGITCSNESESTQRNGDCKKERTFRDYQGNDKIMMQHIKINTGSVKIRIHFIFCDDKIQIGHCGEHLSTSSD